MSRLRQIEARACTLGINYTEPVISDTDSDDDDDEDQWEIKEIISHRTNNEFLLEYLVRWSEGNETQWVLAADIDVNYGCFYRKII